MAYDWDGVRTRRLKATCALVAIATIAVLMALGRPAHARQQSFWIEKVAIIAVGQGICGMQLDDGGRCRRLLVER